MTHDTIKFVKSVLEKEFNCATDNPLVFLGESPYGDQDANIPGKNTLENMAHIQRVYYFWRKFPWRIPCKDVRFSSNSSTRAIFNK